MWSAHEAVISGKGARVQQCKGIYGLHTELWRVLLEVAQELPYKETDDPWILKAEILDKPLKPHFANVQGLKTFEEV